MLRVNMCVIWRERKEMDNTEGVFICILDCDSFVCLYRLAKEEMARRKAEERAKREEEAHRQAEERRRKEEEERKDEEEKEREEAEKLQKQVRENV